MSQNRLCLPENGRSKEDVLKAMQAVREKDVKWQQGKAFSLVFYAGDQVAELLKEAYTLFFSENGLNPMAFPSLRKFETEVVAMSADLLGGDAQVCGNMTSGGTESILMAVKTAREWARANKPDVTLPEIILPATAHPAFHKAAHYFGVKTVIIPVRPDFRADVEAAREAVNSSTVLMVGSAPSYPQGVVDPIPELASIARQAGILLHVDACVGGFFLPFIRKLGYPVPDFDFGVAGVTSISADLHKYAYAAKGASVILYRNQELRRHQFFVSTDWSGGIYASPTMTGTRPGGAIAAAWAIMNFLGEKGYLEIAAAVMKTTIKLRDGIEPNPWVKVLSNPDMSILAIGSDKLNIYEIGDEMTQRGWHLDRQQFPPSLHLTVNYAHTAVADDFLADLSDSISAVRKPSLQKFTNSTLVNLAQFAVKILPKKWVSRLTAQSTSWMGSSGSGLPERSAAMYGLMGSLPNREDINEAVLELIDQMTRPEPPVGSY